MGIRSIRKVVENYELLEQSLETLLNAVIASFLWLTKIILMHITFVVKTILYLHSVNSQSQNEKLYQSLVAPPVIHPYNHCRVPK